MMALLAMGGHGRRLGFPKGLLLRNDGMLQWQYMDELLRRHSDSVYFSLRKNVRSYYPDLPEKRIIYDSSCAEGPMAGLLAAFHHFPGESWLYVAVDLINLKDAALVHLIQTRASLQRKKALLFFFEVLQPLCAIYEPAFAADLERHAARGQYSLRLAAEESEHYALAAGPETDLQNINYPEDVLMYRNKLETQRGSNNHA